MTQRSPVTYTEVLVLSAFYGAILFVSVRYGYLLGMALLAVGLVVNRRVMLRLLKTYLWDQWRIINAETMERRYLGPDAEAGRAGQAGSGQVGEGGDAEGQGDAGGAPEATGKNGEAPQVGKVGKVGKADRAGKGGKGGKAGREARAAKAGRRGKRSSGMSPSALGPADLAPGWQLDWRPLVILVFSAVMLTVLEYYGSRKDYMDLFPKFFPFQEGFGFRELGVSTFGAEYQRLGEYVYWAGFRVGAFFVLPLLFVLCLPGERIRDYGLSTKGFFEHLWIYGVLLLIVLPAVVAVSFTHDFANHYPFYKPWQNTPFPRELYLHDFLLWQVMYALQFFSLEFFFRGFMLQSLKRSMGAYAIFVMAVPYCMIHFGKPLPETLGAVAAGIVLGTLALRTGSIWAGVFIHVSVAWTMDVLALLQTGHWPVRW